MEIREIIKHNKYCIVDVREPFEFERGHISGAINLPLSRFMIGIEQLKNCDGHILFYCRSGMRSGQATAFLQGQGYTNVRNAGSLFQMETYLRDAV